MGMAVSAGDEKWSIHRWQELDDVEVSNASSFAGKGALGLCRWHRDSGRWNDSAATGGSQKEVTEGIVSDSHGSQLFSALPYHFM